jgi:excisionase family DNA binding protein
MNDTLLTTREAAAYLNVKERTLAAHWDRWGLTVYQVGRANMYRVSDLERYLEDHKKTAPVRRVA